MKKALLLLLCAAGCPDSSGPAQSDLASGQDARVDPEADGGADAGSGSAFLGGEMVGRPTGRSVTIGMIPGITLETYVEVGTTQGNYTIQTPATMRMANQPFATLIEGLAPNTRYVYRVRYRKPGEPNYAARSERSFRTQRTAGSTFQFTVQSDSHLDENTVLEQYQRTLANVATDAPDFHMDLGDTFMCDKHPGPFETTLQACKSAEVTNARYIYERGHFTTLSHSSALFLVNGNHEGEAGFAFTGTGMDVATYATKARQTYFLNPIPDGFYSGDSMVEPIVGTRASWYSFQWGDALFVALDPYWYTTKKSNSDGWVWTLGARQYQWLGETLRNSKARFKFVFLHNLVGGLDGQMRGGAEAAPYFEWGGKNLDGTQGLATQRPGWTKSIHQLLVENQVSAVFHGHDHLYAYQQLDGVVYQEVPQPSAKNTNSGANLAKAYHYDSGTIFSSAGHLRITVAPDKVTGEYVRSWLPASETAQRKNGQIDHTWTILPK